MTETNSIIEKVDLFIAPSKYLMNRFTADFNLPQNKIVYLDYGFPLQYLMPTLKTEPRNIYTFGYIGTHIPAKGIHQLIQAFSKLSQPAKLIIYGRENGQVTQSLKAMANECINPVEFAGEYINHNLANQVFSKVDCIVVPSIWAENSPLVIHEAQACKIPAITADFGGMSEYVHHHVNGLLFEHRNVDALAEQLEWAVSNPEKMKHYGKRGYLYSETGNVPDIQDHCKKLELIYPKVKNQSKLWRITIDTNPEDCNLHCVMCEEHSPYSDFIPKLFQETGIKRRRMDITTVEQIFQQASALGVKEIIPSTMGEPLLYKGIERIFELAKAHNIKINLTTNGTFPRKTIDEWARIIVPNTTDIKISWNGATKGTSEAVMKGLNFEKVLENTKSLIELRNEHFTQTGYFCRITLQLTFMRSNMHELSDIIKLAASLGIDRVKGHHLWAHFQEIQGESMKHSKVSIADWNRYVADAVSVSETNLKPNGEKVILENILPINENEIDLVPFDYECPFLGKELWISATGKISPCCAPDKLRASLGDFGNIDTQSISELLSSDIYQNLVLGYKDNELCKTCNMRKPK